MLLVKQDNTKMEKTGKKISKLYFYNKNDKKYKVWTYQTALFTLAK